MSTLERRFNGTALRAVAARTDFSSSPGTLVGYAAKFSSGSNQNWSDDLGGFRERVDPRCFDRALSRGDDARATINHDANKVIGRVSNKTLKLNTDDIGLRAEIVLPNTSYAKDLYESVKRGDISEMSFAFNVDDDSWEDCVDPDDARSLVKVRTLKSCRLVDVAAVCYPAYPATTIAPKAMTAAAGRARSYDQLFPEGAPIEVRSRVPDIRERLERGSDRRRRLTNQVLSI